MLCKECNLVGLDHTCVNYDPPPRRRGTLSYPRDPNQFQKKYGAPNFIKEGPFSSIRSTESLHNLRGSSFFLRTARRELAVTRLFKKLQVPGLDESETTPKPALHFFFSEKCFTSSFLNSRSV